MTIDLERIFETYGLLESVYDRAYYEKYMDAVLEKNKVMNLTGITDPMEFIYKHYVDSLSVLLHYPITKTHKVLDLGTGAGFPGVPIKLYTDCDITLLDALNKRIKFIDETLKPLGIDGYHAIHGRAEELAMNQKYRGQYDFVLTRAVAHIRTLTELSIPFLKRGGYFIAFKGPQYTTEMEESKTALRALGAVVKEIIPFHMPEYDLHHYIIVIEKTEETHKNFPRKFSVIQTNPL